METEEDRRAKLENDVATKRLWLTMETDEERKARLEKMISTTLLRLALETGRKKSKKKEEWILFIFNFKNIFFSRNEFTRPVMGTIFLVVKYAVLIIRLFCMQYKTAIMEACDYFRNSTLDEIARWKK